MTAYAEGDLIGGKYRLERPLSEGGMGRVWVAVHEQLDTRVALKLLLGEHTSSEELRTRFQLEAKAAARVKSPHVVQVFDYGIHGETPYIAMELLEGEDLADVLEREGPLPVERLWPIVSQTCKALRRMHDAGVIHRDLKPGNIFLSHHGDDMVVKVLDFGIAKSVAKGHTNVTTSVGALVGSPPFMSPEQVMASKTLDHRTDLWSLAMILFVAITGKYPFESEAVTELLVRICSAPIPKPSEILPVSPGVDAFFDRALARDPDQRFAHAGELSDAFASLVGIAPDPPSRRSIPTSSMRAPSLSFEGLPGAPRSRPSSERIPPVETLPPISSPRSPTSPSVEAPPARTWPRGAILGGGAAVLIAGVVLFVALSGGPAQSSASGAAAATQAASSGPAPALSSAPVPSAEPSATASATAAAASASAPAASSAAASASATASAKASSGTWKPPKGAGTSKRVFW
jgi:serine/threonine-protein kinase